MEKNSLGNPAVELNGPDNNSNGEDSKLKLRERIALSVGGMVGTAHLQMVSMFLLFFYTDVMLINPAFVAGLFLFARAFDAFAAPFFGIFIDKVNTPWGKYKPWLLILGIFTGVTGWMTFTDFNLSPTMQLVYVTITYLLYSLSIAIGQAPGSAILPAATKRVDDRIAIGTFSYILVLVGAMFVSVGVQPLYSGLGGGNDATGFSMLMGGVAVIGILITVFQVLTIKERYITKKKNDEKQPSLKTMLVAVFTNKAAVTIYIYILALNLANGVRSGIMIHYFKYYFNNEALIVTVGSVTIVPMILGAILSPLITKRIGIKANVLLAAAVNVVTMVAVFFIPASPAGVTAFIAISVFGSLFTGFSSPAQSAMMPAAMDYTEWKSGINVNAFMGSLQGFVQTFAGAIAGSVAAGALAVIGYEPGVEQSDGTLLGLKIIMSFLPAFIIAFTASVAWFDLTEDRQKQIAKDLAERRNND
ncbi:glycoside-pentoside-hexuronide (GPH):cation symporter [Terribacillus saccharophilus]|uniref:MFS transporter n=1 Tax=Terribacillus saccharophilus TaxID=361277 RepID=UPI0039827108